MTSKERLILALGIAAVDTAIFVIPLTAYLIAFVLIVRPRWFKKLVDEVYEPSCSGTYEG